ncbi:hypothetical protein G6011_11677 [Alternaria panax]|uniref:Uncharacterized protein n=1 Tax=Alternaria panax TaxID=48097 RepID=A0AAD4IEB7_9PLEO|nr:hypothetical protein G6011_11677 [Alternaria panax]
MAPASTDTAASEMELVQYFENVVVGILPTLGRDKMTIGRVLMRMALAGRSKASKAVLLSLIAFASRHRGNDMAYAACAKNAAIDVLIIATGSEMDADTSIEHIAAGLTLCLVETDLDCDWIGLLCGAKKVVPVVEQKKHEPGSDGAVMLEWLYHFDTFTRFSFRHWRTYMIRSTSRELGFVAAHHECIMQNRIARAAFTQTMSTTTHHAHPVLQLLAEVFETRLYTSDPHYHSIEYQQSLDGLKSRLTDVDLVTWKDGDDSDQSQCLEFSRLAGLTYLERVSRNFSGLSSRLDIWIEEALSMLPNLNTYPPSFAMFIVGCETHTDKERMVMLDFFTRLEQAPHLNSLLETKGLVQTAWIQHDLGVEGELEYIHKINLVMSSRDVIPSFM